MELKNFKVTARQKSKRKKTFELGAISKERALEFAYKWDIVEIIDIQEIERLPTENQLKYAKDLKIKIPESITFYDISALIDKKVNEDSEPTLGLIDFADNRKLGFSKYIGEMALYNLVFNSLDGIDKIAFFIFSIYKWVANDNQANLDTHLLKDRFFQFAMSLKDDEQFLKSMNKYSGQDLIYFGGITQKDGYVLASGSSTNTIAYKKVADYLSKEFGVFKTKNKTVPSTKGREQVLSKGKGCLVFLIIGFISPFLYLVCHYIMNKI